MLQRQILCGERELVGPIRAALQDHGALTVDDAISCALFQLGKL